MSKNLTQQFQALAPTFRTVSVVGHEAFLQGFWHLARHLKNDDLEQAVLVEFEELIRRQPSTRHSGS